MKKILILIIIAFFTHFVYATQINEVMWNPAGSDNNKEFIEIFSNEKINLSGYIISDGDSNDTLTLSNYSDSHYSVIVESNYELKLFNTSIYSAGAAIGNGLSDGDLITLYDLNETIIDSFLINSSLGGSNNGHSLHYFNGSWSESFKINGTPGKPNFNTFNLTNSTSVNSTNETNNVFINKNKTNSTLNKTLNQPVVNETNDVFNTFLNETNSSINFILNLSNNTKTNNTFVNQSIDKINSTNGTLNEMNINNTLTNQSFINKTKNFQNLTINLNLSNKPCNISFYISTEKAIFSLNETVKFGFELSNSSMPFQIEYQIDNIFGKTVKRKYNTTNLNKKQFTPKIDNNIDVFLIKAKLHACNKTFYNDKQIIVKHKKTDNSSIKIKKIYLENNRTKFGDTFKVKLEVYKGNSSKTQLEIWVEGAKRISEITYANLNSKYTLYRLTLPVHLKTNCNNKYNSGIYKLVINGFGINNSAIIYIEKESLLCKKIVVKQKIKQNKKTEKSETKVINKGVSYSVEHEKNVEPGKEFVTEIKITNDDDNKHKFMAWSYIFRGPKSYSGSRKSNSKEIILDPHSSGIMELKNVVINTSPGSYKLKIKIKKDDQITNKEFTKDIVVKNSSQEKIILNAVKAQNKRSANVKRIPLNKSLQNISLKNNLLKLNNYKYKSSNYKLKNLIKWALPLLIIFIVFSFFKRL